MTHSVKNKTRPTVLLSWLTVACGALAACTNTPQPMVATPDSVTVRLADAADKAADALQSLSSVEQYRTPAPAPAIAPIPTDALASPLAVDWTGPIEPLLKRLAARTAYQYKTQGSPPAAPIDVTVNVADQPIIDTLRDIGLQAGSRANLTVDSNAHVIQLTYGPQIR